MALALACCAEREPAAVVRAAPHPQASEPAPPVPENPDTNDAVGDEWEQGCERIFPKTDVSWSESLNFVTRLPDQTGIPSFMIPDQTETISGRTRYRVLGASGSDVTLLRVVPEPAESGEFPARDIGLSKSGEIEDPSPPLLREGVLTDLDRLHVEHGGLARTLSKTRAEWVADKRAPAVEHVLQPLLVEVVGENAIIEARYTGVRQSGGVGQDVFLLHVKGEIGAVATCHGRSDKRDMFGELVLRSADSVLVSLALSGGDQIVEDICSVNGQGRDIVGRHVAHTELHVAAPCFQREPAP